MMVSEALMDFSSPFGFAPELDDIDPNLFNLFEEQELFDVNVVMDWVFPPDNLPPNINEIMNDIDSEEVLGASSPSWNDDINNEGPLASSEDPMMCLVNPDELLKVEEEEDTHVPYHPHQDHAYTNRTIPSNVRFEPLLPIKIEINDESSSDIDVWNKPSSMLYSTLLSTSDQSSEPPSPPPSKLNRRRKAKASPQVSINRAAKAVLKSQGSLKRSNPSCSNMTTRKRRKFSNSVETSPSGSDCEELMKYRPMPPPQKKGGRRGAPLKKSAKPTKSEVQRNTHNENEKARREFMASMMSAVKDAIPVEFYRDKTENAKKKASKQKVLQAARSYVLYLREDEDYDEEERRINMDRKYELNCIIEGLSAARAKKSRFAKKWVDKYIRVKGRPYKPKGRR